MSGLQQGATRPHIPGPTAGRALMLALLVIAAITSYAVAQSRPAERHTDPSGFPWPEGNKMALSLSFDDGLSSQVTNGVPLLDSFGVRATFYVQPDSLERELDKWKAAVAAGHEIANHSLYHPCTGNFTWVRYDDVALESYDLERMEKELLQANARIETLLGVRPVSYAYPCGHTFVGRGRHTRSYVPLVAEMFQSGRRWMDEASNAPHHVDLAQVMARKMDGEEFSRIRRRIERTRREQNWLVLAGHSIRDSTRWGTDTGMLRELAAYVSDAANEVWVAPVGEVAAFIAAERGKRQSP